MKFLGYDGLPARVVRYIGLGAVVATAAGKKCH